MLRSLLFAVLAVSTLAVQGCGVLLQDRRDAPWDPRGGQGIGMNQIPNWDDEALKICAGHLPANQRRPGQSGRC